MVVHARWPLLSFRLRAILGPAFRDGRLMNRDAKDV